MNRGVFLPSSFVPIVATLFPCCLYIRFVYNYLYISIFCSKIVLLPSHSVEGMSSHLSPLFAGRIFFCCFGMSCLVCIVWSYPDIFSVILLSPVPSDLSLQVVSFVLIVLLCTIAMIWLCVKRTSNVHKDRI